MSATPKDKTAHAGAPNVSRCNLVRFTYDNALQTLRLSAIGGPKYFYGDRMFKKFAMAAAALSMTTVSANAAATINFYKANSGVPSYGTASVIEAFTGTSGTAAFPTTAVVSKSISTTGYTGTLKETVTAAQVNKNSGASYAAYSTKTGFTGTGLSVKGGSIDLDFSGGIRFLKFIISNYQNSAVLTAKYTDGSSVTTTVGAFTNLFTNTTIAPGAGSNYGTFILDAGTGLKIASINLSTTGGSEVSIDEIAAAAPEPAAWLMMILGFGLAGLQLRKRRAMAFTAA